MSNASTSSSDVASPQVTRFSSRAKARATAAPSPHRHSAGGLSGASRGAGLDAAVPKSDTIVDCESCAAMAKKNLTSATSRRVLGPGGLRGTKRRTSGGERPARKRPPPARGVCARAGDLAGGVIASIDVQRHL